VPKRATKVAAKAASRKQKPAQRQVAPVKRQQSPGTLAAVKAFEQALRLFNRHDYSGARAAFDDILKRFADQAEIVAGVRTYLAIIEQRLARTPAVPKNPDALYNSGVFELNRGNAREAVELFEKALKAEPRADHLWYSLSAAYARLNDPPKALDALRRAIAIHPVHRPHARRDPDFANLHGNDDFRQLTGFGFDFVEE
jgi:tetratricopeptide (TPR) repeat protein